MDVAAFVNLVSNVGFPIAVAVAMAWFIYQIFKKTMAQQEANMAQVQARCKDREDKLYEELANCRAVNEKAIDTIAHYAEKLDTIQADISDIKTDVTVLMSK